MRISRLCQFLFLLFPFFIIQPAFSNEPPHYKIKAQVDTNNKSIDAHQTVTFTNNTSKPLNELYFHVYPNRAYTQDERNLLMRFIRLFKVNPFPEGFQEPQFSIQSVTQNNQSLNFSIEGDDKTLLKVSLQNTLNPNESIKVDLHFFLKVPHSYGRFGWHEDITALSRWYPILSQCSDNGWQNYLFFPFHRPFFTDAAQYSLEITLPKNNVLIHSGVQQQEIINADETKTILIESKLPIREFTMALSPQYQVYAQQWNNVLIKVFYLPGSERSAKKAWQFAKDMIVYYSNLFGEYPYQEFSIAPVYLAYGGEQMSNMIFVDTRVFDLPELADRYFDFLISHETGHQWFYNIVGMDEYKEMWLEEGVHSHFVLEYLESKYGKGAEIANFPKWYKDRFSWLLPEFTFQRSRDVRYQMLTRIGLDHPVLGDLAGFHEPSSIFAITYGKGSRVVKMLKEKIGEEAFNKVFQRIFIEKKHQNLSVDEFKKMCEAQSGQDLTEFFQSWLYSEGYCDIAVRKMRDGKIHLIQKGDIHSPAEIKVFYKDGTSKDIFWSGKEEILNEDGRKVVKVVVDPQEKLLEIDRTNNTWPRRINVMPVPIYLGLYDVPIFTPEDSHNLVIGSELANSGLGVKASFQKPYEYNAYVATDFDFSEKIQHSRWGYQINNLFRSPTTLGFEMRNRSDYDGGQEDLLSEEVFLRRELWPVPYGVGEINDHTSLYLVRNQGFNKTLLLGGAEDDRNISYAKKNEAIVGANIHINNSSPYPDPYQGYKVSAFLENSGHFLNATQFFYRSAIDTNFYQALTPRSKLALRLKYGWGWPDDKNLFQLGGMDGLRGYDRKEVRGANALLTSAEYRFPLKENLNLKFFDNIIGVESVSGVIFWDGGQGWFNDFADATFKNNVGAGVRATVTVGSFLEKFIVRADVAQAISDDQEDDVHYWFGVGHAF